MFIISKDGFMLLVMGYNGKKAINIKLAYLAAFNLMDEHIHAKPALPEAKPAKKRVVKALPEAQKAIDGSDILKLIGEKYDLKGFDAINVGSREVRKILDQYPDVGENTLKAIMIKAKYVKALRKVYELSLSIKNDLKMISSVPFGQTRDTLNKTNVCADRFIETIHADHYRILDLGRDFSDTANNAISSVICVARMQDL